MVPTPNRGVCMQTRKSIFPCGLQELCTCTLPPNTTPISVWLVQPPSPHTTATRQQQRPAMAHQSHQPAALPSPPPPHPRASCTGQEAPSCCCCRHRLRHHSAYTATASGDGTAESAPSCSTLTFLLPAAAAAGRRRLRPRAPAGLKSSSMS
jgi:hypothetical protein